MAAVPNVRPQVGLHAPASPAVESARVLFERYSDQIFRYCYVQLGSREDAEDAVQSTFLNAFRGLNRGVVPELESAWLYKIAHNVCLARGRSRQRRGRVETPGDLQALAEVIAGPERVDDERLVRLADGLRSMPRSQRQAILLREWRGMSYREIGDRLGLTQAAVETLLFRARRSLADALERPERRSRVRALFDGSSLLGAVKGLFGGAAAKTAAVVAVAVVTSAGLVVAGGGDGSAPARGSAPQVPSPGTSAGPNGAAVTAARLAARPPAGKADLPPSGKADLPAAAGVDGLAAAAAAGVAPASPATAATGAAGEGTSPSTPPGSDPPAPGAPPATATAVPATDAPRLDTVAPATSIAPAARVVPTKTPPPRKKDEPERRRDGDAPGSSALAPGKTGAAPGQSGETPANGAPPPGHSGAAPGKSGETPGHVKQETQPPPAPPEHAASEATDKEPGPPEHVPPAAADPSPPATESPPPGQEKKGKE